MNINKALEHFEWKFKNSWKPTKRDLEAYNAIVDYKEIQESKSLSEHESLAKLFIHQLILLSRTNMYNGERCIQIIDEILDKSVYEWCVILKNEIPMMRFNSIGMGKYQIDTETVLNRTKLSQINNEIINEFETELTEALISDISEENIIKFVQKEINRIINKYEK
jgi:hypothetical protein